MKNFNDFKNTSVKVAVKIKDTTIKCSKDTKIKISNTVKITKLKNKISKYNHEIEKSYQHIGKNYYNLYKDNSDDNFFGDCSNITLYKEKIEQLLDEINNISNKKDI